MPSEGNGERPFKTIHEIVTEMHADVRAIREELVELREVKNTSADHEKRLRILERASISLGGLVAMFGALLGIKYR